MHLFTDGEVKTKDGRKFTRMVGGFGKDKPIFTIWQAGELLALRTAKILEDFKRNECNFKINIDFIDLKSAILQKDSEINVDIAYFLRDVGYSQNQLNATKRWLVFSFAGMMKLVKISKTKESWNIYSTFLEDYFKTKAENVAAGKTLTEEIDHLTKLKINILCDMFIEKDYDTKMELFGYCEKINSKITKLRISESNKELLNKLEPQLSIANKFINSNTLFDISTFSKILCINNLGRNNMFGWLRDSKILMANNQPYKKYMKYFKVIAVENKNSDRFNCKTMITPKGILYLLEKLIFDNKVICKPVNQILKELA